MVSVRLPSDALLQHLPSYLGFSYLERGVSLHSCSSKTQPLLLPWDEGYLLMAAPPALERGVALLGPPAPAQPPLLGCGQRRKDRYSHLNAEFQRIARRDKKAFLSNPCREIEENNRMGKTRDLFKKIRDTKGNFHAKMGSIKERNCMDLTETEDIKKRWQEYTEQLFKKILMTQITTMV